MSAPRPQIPSPTPETIGSGARAVTSVPIALIDQHLRIDLAEGTVASYRRLVSHLSLELAFVVRIPRPAPGKPHWDEWDEDHKAMVTLKNKFLHRNNPYGASPAFRPLDGDPENVKYEILIGDWGPKSTVMGADLAAGVRAMLEPYRDVKFEDATMPLFAIHLEGHEFLEKYGLMRFESQYSNAAPTHTDQDWLQAKDASESLLQETAENEKRTQPKSVLEESDVEGSEDDFEEGDRGDR